MEIGFIGLGAMGERMARRLLGAGHRLTVWDRNQSKIEALVHAGARGAATPAEALQGEMVISALFDDAAIQAVLIEPGHFDRAAPGLVHVCTSTITVAFARELLQHHAARDLALVGAPMLGRPEVIERGGLNLIAAAEPALLDRAEVPLAVLGRVWRLSADPVHAYVAKLAANFMISGALEAMAEAVAVLDVHGADPQRFLSILGETLFSSSIYKSYGPLVAGTEPDAKSGLALPIKDNRSFLQASAGAGLHLPLAEAIRTNLARAVEQGAEHEDWSTALAMVASGRGSNHPSQG